MSSATTWNEVDRKERKKERKKEISETTETTEAMETRNKLAPGVPGDSGNPKSKFVVGCHSCSVMHPVRQVWLKDVESGSHW